MNIVFSFLLRCILCANLLHNAAGHATEMLSRCSLALTPGTKIMGTAAVSSSSRSVIVKRGSTTLTSGASYVYGETLTVSLSSTSGEYNLQSSGATFSGGSCSSTRLANTQGSLVLPTSGSTTVSVLGAWASSQSTVYISSSFYLTPPVSTANPTVAPSISFRPTSLAPTHPTFSPTSAQPTISFAPSAPPTLAPSAPPTLEPTDSPTNSPASAAVSAATVKTVVGVVVGAAGALGVLLSAYAYSARVVAGTLDRKVVNLLVVRLVATMACLLALAMIILLAQWARGADAADPLLLATPSWPASSAASSAGLLSYHASLMTSGFLAAQIFAAAAWSLGRVREYAKLAHVLAQTAGLACAIGGFVAIVEYQSRLDTPALATMHSLVGVAAVALFGASYVWGAVMALLTMYHPSSVLRRAIDLRAHHKKLGVAALGVSLAAALTGVMNALPMGACYADAPGYAADPAAQYPELYGSCRLGLGVGVCALLAVLCVGWAVADRGESFAVAPAPAHASASAAVSATPAVAVALEPSAPAGVTLEGVELGGVPAKHANGVQYAQVAVHAPV